jgi:hypothetical protein
MHLFSQMPDPKPPLSPMACLASYFVLPVLLLLSKVKYSITWSRRSTWRAWTSHSVEKNLGVSNRMYDIPILKFSLISLESACTSSTCTRSELYPATTGSTSTTISRDSLSSSSSLDRIGILFSIQVVLEYCRRAPRKKRRKIQKYKYRFVAKERTQITCAVRVHPLLL